MLEIILDEAKWVENIIQKQTIGVSSGTTITRLAKYYTSKGYSAGRIRILIEDFLLRCDSCACMPEWTRLIDKAITRAKKYPLIKIDAIEITDTELELIGALNTPQIRKLAFTLLCLSKYCYAINPESNHWINYKNSDIARLANITTSKKKQAQMYAELEDLGYVTFSKKIDGLGKQIHFSQPGETVLVIENFNDLGNRYQMFRGDPYFECCNCGRVIRNKKEAKTGRKRKYCDQCAVEVKLKQDVEAVTRSRHKV